MYLKVPEVNKCCFCCSLRWGIILFAYINIILSAAAAVCMVVSTELQKSTAATDYTFVESVIATMLFAIFGMVVILNILLLVGGYQKDAAMLRLHNAYATATVVVALVATSILISRIQIIEGFAALFAIAVQCYVIVLVRSEITKMKQMKSGAARNHAEGVVDVPDTESLVC